MARTGQLAALAVFTLMGTPLQTGLAEGAGAPVAVGARLSQDENGAKLVFDLSRPVEASASALASPDRIVIDLPEVSFQVGSSASGVGALPNVSLVRAFRFGPLTPGKSRVVIDLERAACPAMVSSRPIVEGEPAARLTIELKACDPSAFEALVRSSAISTTSALPAATLSQPVIVLDPGHGGLDSGARGLRGLQEKTLVFDFCAELKRQLDKTQRYSIVMTRYGDQYVDLDDRVAIARKANASLFISVHADTLSEDANVSGSTVYTSADRASDAEAARIAARENADGRRPNAASRPGNPDVADILFDLKRRETRTYAHIFSRGLIESLKAATRLNHNPERSAGFVVLKAPEFPSVLVELGYLSNAQDVQSLSSPEWQTRTAAATVREIDAFFAGPGKPDNGPSAESGVASSAVQDAAPLAH
jgi:N-acetylmuramoyl-L-alanine amidase